MNCSKCGSEQWSLFPLANKSYCMDCLNDIHKKIFSRIDPNYKISYLEMEMLLSIFKLAEENGFACFFQYEIEDENITSGCAIEDQDYQEDVCRKNHHDCNKCRYNFCNTNIFLRYILDFALIKDNKKIDIELDGFKYHKERRDYDSERNKFMEGNGWIVIRFSYEDVFKHRSMVIQQIKENLR